MRALTRSRVGESRVLVVTCTSPHGGRQNHRVRVAADGHLCFYDHPRGEVARALEAFDLAGVRPDGCYALLRAWRVLVAGGGGCGGYYGPATMQNEGDALMGRYAQMAENLRMLRLALREQPAHATCLRAVPMRPRFGAGVWALTLREPARLAVFRYSGIPSMYNLNINGDVVSWGGWVAARPRRGKAILLWDAAVPGVMGLLRHGTELSLPGPMTLLRVTEQVLAGWRGIVPREGTAAVGACAL